jgi:uroporphyrinogen decarboxylase
MISRKELFHRACCSEPVPRVPVWIMRQAGRYLPEYRAVRARHSFLEVCKTPELAIEVSLQPFRILGVDAVIVFSDILIPAEAMGMALELTDSGPVLANPIRDAAGVSALREFDPCRETRFVGEAIRGLCRELGPDVPVLGFAGAPWTLACYLVEGQTRSGFDALKRMMYSQPALLRALLEKIARATGPYLQMQLEAGAAAVQLFDTWAGELSAEDYAEFALPVTQNLIAAVRAPGKPVILYTKGSSHLLGSLARAGADVLSVDWRTDLKEVRRLAGARTPVQGNVDPAVLLGTPDSIRRAVERAVTSTHGLGHILNLGHGITPGVPVENAKFFVECGQKTALPEPAAAQAAREGA